MTFNHIENDSDGLEKQQRACLPTQRRSTREFWKKFRPTMKSKNVDTLVIFIGELIATAILMFLGCMGCVKTEAFPNTGFQSSVNFGFVVLIAIQCYGCVSGAHLNPAVTLAAWIYNLISLPMALLYFIAQIFGAFIGYGLLRFLLPPSTLSGPETPNGLCVTALHSEISPWQGLCIEFIITCVLIMICCGVWDPRNAKYGDSVPVRFALAIACISFSAGSFTGASMNPARSLSPAVWNSYYEHQWIYWIGPMSAAAVTAFVYKLVFRREVNDVVVTENCHEKCRVIEEMSI